MLIPLNDSIPDTAAMSKKVVTDDLCESLLFGIISEHYNLQLINLACLFPIIRYYIYLQTHNAVFVFESLVRMSPKIAEAVVGRTMLAPFSNLIGDSWQYKAAL
jgi:hypothetical protein